MRFICRTANIIQHDQTVSFYMFTLTASFALCNFNFFDSFLVEVFQISKSFLKIVFVLRLVKLYFSFEARVYFSYFSYFQSISGNILVLGSTAGGKTTLVHELACNSMFGKLKTGMPSSFPNIELQANS